jgi:hypothetical protein
MDSTEDLTTSHDMINECAPDLWSDFEEVVKMLQDEDLANIAERLGISPQESWEDYCREFSNFEWYQFCDAYQRVLARPFSVS